MEKFLKALIVNTPLALVVFGMFLFLVGAAGGSEKFSLHISGLGWQVAIASMGFVLVTFGALLIWYPRAAHDSGSRPDNEAIRKLCKLSIQTSTAIDRGHPNQYLLTGKYKQLPPPGMSVWLITASLTSQNYWPQNEVGFDGTKMEWNALVGLGPSSRPDEKMRVILAIIGDCGETLFRYYLGTRDKLKPDSKLPLPKLPHDVIECATVVLDKRI